MRAHVVPTRFEWFKVLVIHDNGVFHNEWELGPETPYKIDAEVRANRFNESLDETVTGTADIYRPSLSMCEDAYRGKTSPTKHSL